MNKMSLLVLAGGMGSRYKGQKQIDALSDQDESLMEFALYDAVRLGIKKVVFIINKQFPENYKDHLVNKLKRKGCSAYFVEQTLLKYVPEAYEELLEDRVKPLGTAHAVYCAKDIITEPFITVNADDYYGAQSFEAAVKSIKDGDIDENNYAMLAFQLKNTLSKHGSVSRGICKVTEGYLESVEEFTSIVKNNGNIQGMNSDYEEESLSENAKVSMNFWVLHPSFFELAEKGLFEFLEHTGDLSSKEYYLPTVIDQALADEKIKVKAIPTQAEWFGLTYRDDKATAVKKIEEMKAEKKYPEILWD